MAASTASQASQAGQTMHAAHAAHAAHGAQAAHGSHAAQTAPAPDGSAQALRNEIAELQALRNELVQAHHRQRLGAGVGEAEERLLAQQALELQRQVAATEVWQQGLHAAGGQLVARMTWLQDDIAARCRAVEANARDDVRRGFVACTPDPAMRERLAALVAGQE